MKLFKNFRRKFERFDLTLIFLVYILCTVSTIFIYSATRSRYYLKQNIIWILIGTVFLLLSIFIDYEISLKYITYIYLFSILLLLYVRFFGVVTLGARRWITVFGFKLQPSEFIKILIIMILSYIMATKFKDGINNIKDIIMVSLSIMPFLVLILTQPDLGTTLIVLFSYGCMLFLSNANIRPLVYIGLILILLSYPIYKFGLDDYQKQRVEVFLNPEKDIRGKGWNVSQSKISVGSGGLYGTGLYNGSQSRLKFLPEPQTDFIFSVIAEETGFLGSSTIILIYFFLIWRMINISRKVYDAYGRNIIYGIVGIFFGHTIVNIGMTIGLVPVTGKTLLFLSYGGSSYLSSFIMIALVESIKVYSDDLYSR
ncbi:rod shape-determining protein RodA [Oceanivirga miroungae]|uniref:Rod shape-determining protein RodA n=1 Tax=Oceanivirga miroungae TaxID=1130046 RepID=A0A6I8MA08_9FUSO|nr:rod shape-determining protein RodA [Oceanivirga miroungae]VWL85157.1 rod shape-determining protein RodA [Oceanivirga miroungae]